MPQCHLASHAIAVGVDMRRKHDPAAGREHRGDLGGRARALGGNRDSVRVHGIKYTEASSRGVAQETSRKNVTQKRHARASHKDVARTGYLYGARLPTSDRRWLGSVTVPLTARVSFRSRYVPTNCVEAGIVKVTVIPSGFEVAYVPL